MTTPENPTPDNTVEKNEVERAQGVETQQAHETAEATGEIPAAQPTDIVEPGSVATQPATTGPISGEDGEPLFTNSVEGVAPGTQAAPSTLTLQSDEPAPAAQIADELAPQPVAPGSDKPEEDRRPESPVLSQTAAEINAGRARVQEAEGQQALLKAKRESDKPEGEQIAAAGEVNKEL